MVLFLYHDKNTKRKKRKKEKNTKRKNTKRQNDKKKKDEKTKRKKVDRFTDTKKGVRYCDVSAFLHSCNNSKVMGYRAVPCGTALAVLLKDSE